MQLPRHILPLIIGAGIAFVSPAAAQGLGSTGQNKNSDTEEQTVENAEFWKASLTDVDKGEVCILLSSITTVALHTYMLDGTIEITECTVDTTGNNSIRFYAPAEDPVGVGKEVRKALRNTKYPAALPARKFPEGVYSHNIEYQLSSPEKVKQIYDSITRSRMNRKTATTVKNINK